MVVSNRALRSGHQNLLSEAQPEMERTLLTTALRHTQGHKPTDPTASPSCLAASASGYQEWWSQTVRSADPASGVEAKQLHPETETALTRLAWPGNVRQLENTCRWLCLRFRMQLFGFNT
jgi:DNA-binding NtrC family response regulator